MEPLDGCGGHAANPDDSLFSRLRLHRCIQFPRYPRAPLTAGQCSHHRSEEHTSELQSPYDLVCRLLPFSSSTLFPYTTLFRSLLLGIVQSIAFTGGDGQRWSLSMDVEATRQTLTILFFLGFAFIVASNFLVTRERLLRLANALTIFGAALAAFALVQHFAWNGSFYWLRPTTQSVFGPFVNRNHFAGYMAMLMPVPLALILHVVRGHGRLLFGFAAALMGTAAIISNSRSGVISLAGSMVFMMILKKRDTVRVSTIEPIAIVALAVIAGVLWVGASEILEHC